MGPFFVEAKELKKRMITNKIFWLLVFGFVLIAGVCLKYDICIEQNDCYVKCICEKRVNSIAESIMGMCDVVWPMACTIIMFLIEFGHVYWYGINFKRIIQLSLGNKTLMFGVIGYFFTYPIMRIYEIAEIWCSYFFAGFCVLSGCFAIIIYALCKIRKGSIKNLLLKATIMELKVQLENKDFKCEYLQAENEKLQIMDMIKHIDYDNAAEVREMIDVLTKIFEELIKMNKIQYGYVTLQIWVKCIINFSGIDTMYEKEHTEYVIRRLWENITDIAEKRHLKIEDMITLHILCPLIELGTETSTDMFLKLWESMKPVQSQCIWYLLLYEEFLYYKRGVKEWDYGVLMHITDQDFRRLWNCIGTWNKKTARRLWIYWGVIQESGENMALTMFNDFCHDVEKIMHHRNDEVATWTMKKIYLGMR